MEIRIESVIPFNSVHSRQHAVTVYRDGVRKALVRLKNAATIPNRDFVLSYDVVGDRMVDCVLVHKKDNGYFMFPLQPPRSVRPEQVVPKELVFVLDTSGSMSGFPIEKAKQTIKSGRFRPGYFDRAG